jgi:hypothetical protein
MQPVPFSPKDPPDSSFRIGRYLRRIGAGVKRPRPPCRADHGDALGGSIVPSLSMWTGSRWPGPTRITLQLSGSLPSYFGETD